MVLERIVNSYEIMSQWGVCFTNPWAHVRSYLFVKSHEFISQSGMLQSSIFEFTFRSERTHMYREYLQIYTDHPSDVTMQVTMAMNLDQQLW